jgi:hypothetical protein
MNYIALDHGKGLVYFPKTFFDDHHNEIIKLIPNFVFTEQNDVFTIIQLPKILPAKRMLKVIKNGIEVEDSTCTFCRDRLICMTNDFSRCSGFKSIPTFQVNMDNLSSFLNEKNMKIIYARMG